MHAMIHRTVATDLERDRLAAASAARTVRAPKKQAGPRTSRVLIRLAVLRLRPHQ